MGAEQGRPGARRLASQAGILTLGNASAVLVQIAVGIFLARSWSREAYGSFLQVTLLVATLSPMLYLGIPSALYYFLPRWTGERRGPLLVQSAALLTGLGLAGAAAMALASPALAAALHNDGLAPAIRRYAFALAGMLPAAAAHPLLVSLQRYGRATLVVSGVAVADAAVTVTAVLAGASLETLVTALAALHVAVGAGVLVALLRTARAEGPVGPRWLDREILVEQLRYAVPFATSIHVGTLARFFDRYLIGLVYAPDLFAAYAVGAREVPIVPLLLSSITIVLQQRFTALHRDGRAAEIPVAWRAVVRKQALLVLPLAAVLWLLADPFITTLYSDRYRDSVPVFRVYLGLLVLRAAAWPIVLAATGHTRTLLAGSLLALATSVATSLALIRPLGLLGPAVGAVAGPALAAAYYLRRTEQVVGLPWRRLVPWSVLARVAAASGGAALLLVPVAARVDGLLPAVPVALACAGLYAALARALGVLEWEDLAFLGDWIRLAARRAAPGRRRLRRGEPRAPNAGRGGRRGVL